MLPRRPNGAAAAELLPTSARHYRVFWQLREHFRIEGLPLFQLTAKSHQVMHSAALSHMLHPRLAWCYKSEDFMGKIRQLALSCARGRFGARVTQAMLQKWIIGYRLSIVDPDAWFWRK